MAKKQKIEENTQGTESTEVKVEAKKEPKPEKVYFLGPKWCAVGSVFGNIKAVIAAHQNLAAGQGVSTSTIVQEMLARFQPKKSGNYGEKYVRAYIRDLEKFGYAVTDPSQAESELTAAPEKAKKETKRTNRVSDTGQKILDKMKELISESEYQSATSTVTAETIQTALQMKPMSASKAVESLIKNGYLSLSEVDEVITLLFTEQGWNHVHQRMAAE